MTTKRKMILSIGADAKTVKGQKLGFTTGILYLAPVEQAGRGNVCPIAKLAGCEKACLYTAGRGGMTNVQEARIAKTRRYFDDYDNFMSDLVWSIEKVQRKAVKDGNKPLIRLNGTSDIIFETGNVAVRDGVVYPSIMEAFPDVQFYDYTKHPTRTNLPPNYDLTFSYSGVASYKGIIAKAIKNPNNARIAVVFDKVENIPTEFLGRKVV